METMPGDYGPNRQYVMKPIGSSFELKDSAEKSLSDRDHMLILDDVHVLCNDRNNVEKSSKLILNMSSPRGVHDGYTVLTIDRSQFCAEKKYDELSRGVIELFQQNNQLPNEPFINLVNSTLSFLNLEHESGTTASKMIPCGGVFEATSALFCPEWPQHISNAFRKRSRKWPSKKLINEVIEQGCYVIPKGHRSSPMRLLSRAAM